MQDPPPEPPRPPDPNPGSPLPAAALAQLQRLRPTLTAIAEPRAVPVDRIRALADIMWEWSGRQDGMADQFWLAAERDLLATLRAGALAEGAEDPSARWVKELAALPARAFLERIQVMAYFIWEATGRQHGTAFDNWLQAENALLSALSELAARLAPYYTKSHPMPPKVLFFAFRFDMVDVKNPRGKIPDNDLVTFNVFVNQLDRGNGAGMFPDVAAGSAVPSNAVPPTTRRGMSTDWIVGPLELAPGDFVTIVYSGTNTSDSELDLSGQAEIEIKILDAIVSAVAGAPGGVVGSAVTTVLGFIGDPVGRFLGFKPQGPCNGLVFSDTVEFSGAGLGSLAVHPPTAVNSFRSLPDASEFTFTRAYTDELTHNAGICGEIAHTEITFSVLRVPFISVRYYAERRFPGVDLNKGVRQLTSLGAAGSIRSLLGLRP